MPEPTCPASPVINPLSRTSETSSTLPGTVARVDRHERLARAGERVLVLDHRLGPLHLAEHQLDQRAPVDLADLVRADAPAVAQHRHAVGELEDLVEPVRHEDDAPALRDEVTRCAEHALDLRLAEGRGRLVEDQQARVPHEQPCDLDELAFADRERLHRRSELHVPQAELVEDGASLLRESPPPVEQRHVEPAQEDVVLDAQLGHEAELLVHERDAVTLRVERVSEREPSPPKRIVPSSGLTSPTSDFSEGLLPAPLCPQTACTSPARTSSDRPCTARTGPNDFERSTTSSSTSGEAASVTGERDPGSSVPDPVRRSSSEARGASDQLR